MPLNAVFVGLQHTPGPSKKRGFMGVFDIGKHFAITSVSLLVPNPNKSECEVSLFTLFIFILIYPSTKSPKEIMEEV